MCNFYYILNEDDLFIEDNRYFLHKMRCLLYFITFIYLLVFYIFYNYFL